MVEPAGQELPGPGHRGPAETDVRAPRRDGHRLRGPVLHHGSRPPGLPAGKLIDRLAARPRSPTNRRPGDQYVSLRHLPRVCRPDDARRGDSDAHARGRHRRPGVRRERPRRQGRLVRIGPASHRGAPREVSRSLRPPLPVFGSRLPSGHLRDRQRIRLRSVLGQVRRAEGAGDGPRRQLGVGRPQLAFQPHVQHHRHVRQRP